MTKEEHIERHKLLHKHLDELLADWASTTRSPFLSRPIYELLEWSHKQSINPDNEESSESPPEEIRQESEKELPQLSSEEVKS